MTTIIIYMGGVLAELMVKEGRNVVFVTPAAEAANWARNTLEQEKIQTRLPEDRRRDCIAPRRRAHRQWPG